MGYCVHEGTNLLEGRPWDVHDVNKVLHMATHVLQFKLSCMIHAICKWSKGF